jgi:hypothetical protein
MTTSGEVTGGMSSQMADSHDFAAFFRGRKNATLPCSHCLFGDTSKSAEAISMCVHLSGELLDLCKGSGFKFPHLSGSVIGCRKLVLIGFLTSNLDDIAELLEENA